MQKQPEGKVSLSQLLRQAQERVREEVLGLLKETFEDLLEALRDEVVGRGRYERSGSGRILPLWLQGEEVLGDLLGDYCEGKDSQGQGC